MRKTSDRSKRLYTITSPKKSPLFTVLSLLFCVYCLLPLAWLVINSTKSQKDFISTFGLGFGKSFDLFSNIAGVFTTHDGIFARWLVNTLMYTLVGGVLSTLIATLGGYALAKLKFRGKQAFLLIIIGSISVPGIALAIPQFLLFAKLGLTNTPWAILIPSLINPFGLYLMWVFSRQAVPTGLLEAATLDGAGALRTFVSVSLPLLTPALVTVFLFSFVSIWNNYFLPLIMLKDPQWYPLTIGLNQWNTEGMQAGNNGSLIQNLVITAALLTIIPLIIAFLTLQKYWQSGLALGSVKE